MTLLIFVVKVSTSISSNGLTAFANPAASAPKSVNGVASPLKKSNTPANEFLTEGPNNAEVFSPNASVSISMKPLPLTAFAKPAASSPSFVYGASSPGNNAINPAIEFNIDVPAKAARPPATFNKSIFSNRARASVAPVSSNDANPLEKPSMILYIKTPAPNPTNAIKAATPAPSNPRPRAANADAPANNAIVAGLKKKVDAPKAATPAA